MGWREDNNICRTVDGCHGGERGEVFVAILCLCEKTTGLGVSHAIKKVVMIKRLYLTE